MRVAVAVVVAFLVVAFAAPGRARADCGPFAWVSAPEGSIPRRGMVFVHGHDAPEIRWVGAPGRTTVHEVGRDVRRIDYESFSADGLVIDRVNLEPSHDWRPKPVPPSVVSIDHSRGTWSCSSWDTVKISINQAVAGFRIVWFYEGRRDEWFEAARLSDGGSGSMLFLGSRNCGDRLIDEAELHDGGHLELYAIRFDGTEVRVLAIPDAFAYPHDPGFQPWMFLTAGAFLLLLVTLARGHLRRALG
ncbi:MAG: hypothetical protein KIT31_15155 [Deltaproteobacteria bacterium]|nr:hypothetical protein [Deltaproteobacteria bacterium]